MKVLTVLAFLYSFSASAAWNANCYVTGAKQNGIVQVLGAQKNLFLMIANEEVTVVGSNAFLPGRTDLPFDEVLRGFNRKKVNSYFGQYINPTVSSTTPEGFEMEYQVATNNFNSGMFPMYFRFNSVLRVETMIYSLACQVVPSAGSTGVQ